MTYMYDIDDDTVLCTMSVELSKLEERENFVVQDHVLRLYAILSCMS